GGFGGSVVPVDFRGGFGCRFGSRCRRRGLVRVGRLRRRVGRRRGGRRLRRGRIRPGGRGRRVRYGDILLRRRRGLRLPGQRGQGRQQGGKQRQDAQHHEQLRKGGYRTARRARGSSIMRARSRPGQATTLQRRCRKPVGL